ncbi:hypothetical protein GOP47_0019990 [Adiantum capillus-veneris]|uniref:Uncharacterized protein n=1 Tax=Adiantum capillus-veneris TaxID=13818 RepID=A0A9D4UCK7_ADICA|nr:hypothetical protein GOP47_0019990 [Adiantum capillus-veneris]
MQWSESYEMSLSADKQQSANGVAGTQEADESGQSSERRQQPIGGWRAAGLILAMEFCERLAFFGIGLNLVTYLHDHMHLPIPRSANIVTNFMGASYLTCLVGGFIADTCLGRYWTTVLGCFIQFLGMVLITLTSMLRGWKPDACDTSQALRGNYICKEASGRQLGVLYMALAMIACGAGGTKSSVSGLGADQFQDEGSREMQSYFNWFGTSVSGGGVLAVTLLVYLQDHAGRSVGYGASAACMGVGLLLLLAGSPLFRSKPPSGSAFTLIAHVLVAAFRNRHLPSSPPSSSRDFSFLNKAALAPPLSSNKTWALDQSPWKYCSMEKVKDVKMLIRLFPILATTIVFWTANGQSLTFSIEQGATLDRRLGKNFEIPPASFPVFLQLGMFFMIPLYDQVLIPLARKWRGNDYGITSLQRIAIGLLISAFSMVVAAFVERRRLKVAHGFKMARKLTERLPMSIFYLAPQFGLIGIGEAFAYVGQIDFFYRESPIGMRSLSTGLCLSTISLGFFLSSALVSCVNRWTRHGSYNGWLTNNLDDGRLDYFYWFLAILSFLSFLAYLLCAYCHKYHHLGEDMSDAHALPSDEKIVQNIKTIN